MSKINGITASVGIREGRTGNIASVRLQVKVEDAELRKQLPEGFDGLERVSVKVPLRGGGEQKVTLPYRTSIDPQPGVRVLVEPNMGNEGPHKGGGARWVATSSGRVADVHELELDADRFDLRDLRNKPLTFEVETNKGTKSTSVEAETLWR